MTATYTAGTTLLDAWERELTSGTPPDLAPALSGFATLDVSERNGVALVALNRPDVHNAFDETLIAELTRALEALEAAPGVRAVVLLGAGPSFCAGADLTWMRRMAAYDYDRNIADARSLAYLLQREGIEPAHCVMLGDRLFDVEAASQCGVASVGVLWGYGSRGELAAASWLAESPAELGALLLQGERAGDVSAGMRSSGA